MLPPKFRGKLDTRFFQLNTILLPVQLFLLAFYSSYIKVAVDKLNQKIKEGKIDVIWNAVLASVNGDENLVTGVSLNKTDSDEIVNINCSGVFIAIGHQPNTSIFKDHLIMDDSGYLNVKGGSQGESTLTSKEGVFAAGDVSDSIYRQAITSAGTGCMAELDAEKYLDE